VTADGIFLATFFVTLGLVVVALVLGLFRLRLPAVIVGFLTVVGGIITAVLNGSETHGTSPIVVLAPSASIAFTATATALAYRARRSVPAAPTDAPLSVISVVALVASFVVSLAGIVLGYIGLRDTKSSTKRGRRLAQAAVIVGWVGLVLGTIVGSFLVWQVLYSSGIIRY
jgi:uncharacterized membrane protein